MEQCPARTSKKGCILLNLKLGWENLLAKEKCDVCWKLGGPPSPSAHDFLDLEARRIVDWAKHPENARRLPREVLVPLTIKHLDPEETRKLEGTITLSMARDSRWPSVSSSWKKAGSFALSLLSSMVTKVDKDTLLLRRLSCETCPARETDGEHSYCGVCGCGKKKMARLDRKLEYPYLRCPLGKPGFSNEEAPS